MHVRKMRLPFDLIAKGTVVPILRASGAQGVDLLVRRTLAAG